jgi:hypothetical protein
MSHDTPRGAAQHGVDHTAWAGDLAIARQLADAGVPLFLARPTGQPLGERPYAEPPDWQFTPATASHAAVEALAGLEGQGWALCALTSHRYDVLDFDPRNGGYDTGAGLSAAGLMPRAFGRLITQRGGRHLLIPPTGRAKRTDLLPGLDFLGRGAYHRIPPTPGYGWESLPDLDELAEGDPDADLILNLLDRTDGRSEQPDDLAGKPYDGHQLDGRERRYLAAALAGEADVVSRASVGHRNVTLFLAALKLGGLVAGAGLAESDVRSALRAAAARCGLPAAETDRTLTSGLAAGMASPRAVPAGLPEWEPPVPLLPVRNLPPFPVAALPSYVGPMVEAVAEFTQTPPDLAGTVGLGVLSACAGGHATVEVRPGWREPVNLFAVVAAASGARKSAVFRVMFAPLEDAEKSIAEQAESLILEKQTQRDIAQRRAAEARTRAAKAPADKANGAAAEAVSEVLFAEGIAVPNRPRLLADDATPEAIAGLLADHGGTIAIVSAEGGIFDLFAGRYNPTTAPNLDVLLKGHAGDLLRVDRRSRPPEHVPHPALTLCLTLQPFVLSMIARNPAFRGRGVLARMLYSLPPNNVGQRRIGTAPVPGTVEKTYAAATERLAAELASWTDPAVLMLTRDAADLLLDFEAKLEPRLAPGADLGGIAEWASKLVGAAARIAGLLHVADHPVNAPITADTMRRALDLATYFLAHALAAFDLMGTDSAVADARYLLGHLGQRGTETFTVRDLFTELPRTRFERTNDLRSALAVLEDHGWLARLPTPQPTGPGRPPSPTYVVHPLTHAAQSAQYAESDSADSADTAAGSREAGSRE